MSTAHYPTGWLPNLTALIHDRPDLAGIGLADAAETVTT